jgi:hypothetical protein
MTVLNLNPYKEQPIPEVGKEYHIFDDGKIRPSRHYIAKILEIIPFEECKDEDLLESWRDEVETCYWLFATETDYFVKAEYDDEMSYFVRTIDGGWFSLGFGASRLDIDGSLYKIMLDQYGEDGKEAYNEQ